MLRSLSSAISGLQNHQSKLDVVGNNIANVNTVGYKAESVRFQEVFSQTLRGATAPFAGRGGVNPMQVGLGMTTSSINTNHSQGSIESTGQETDMAIEGSGFFVVSDGQQNYFTRDGSFVRDSAGYLTNANGLRLMGWLPGADGAIDTSQQLSGINIPLGEDMLAKATELMKFAGNLDSGALADVHYHVEGFMSGLSVNGLPAGAFSITDSAELLGDDKVNVRMLASTTNRELFPLDGIDGDDDVMHLIEVVDKTDNYITLNILSLNKIDGSRTVETVRATRDEAGGPYVLSETVLGIEYDEVEISELVARGDRFLLDFGEADAFLAGTSGVAENQQIAFHSGFDNDETGTLYTLHMNERTGEVFFGSMTADIQDLGDVEAEAVSFQFEPYSYDTYVYDSLGNRHDLRVTLTRHPEHNTWSYNIQHADLSIEIEDPTGNPYSGKLVFTSGGVINPDASDIPVFSFDPGTGADIVNVTPDFNNVAQLRESSNVFVREQDGFYAGELTTFNIEETGLVTGVYTNGMMKSLGQIALASFSNPVGLVKLGNNLYDVTANSGDARIGLPGEMGRGMIQSRALEMSNVDLSQEFTEMITTSRAFQANTRMITTSDEVLTELVNMKR